MEEVVLEVVEEEVGFVTLLRALELESIGFLIISNWDNREGERLRESEGTEFFTVI